MDYEAIIRDVPDGEEIDKVHCEATGEFLKTLTGARVEILIEDFTRSEIVGSGWSLGYARSMHVDRNRKDGRRLVAEDRGHDFFLGGVRVRGQEPDEVSFDAPRSPVDFPLRRGLEVTWAAVFGAWISRVSRARIGPLRVLGLEHS